MNIFISGPMRGYQEFNFGAFAYATEALREMGHEVFSPAEHELSLGFDPKGLKGTSEELAGLTFDLRRALRDELTWLLDQAEAVVALEGWEKSSGARAEVAAAVAIGIPVLGVDMLPIATDLSAEGYKAGYNDRIWDEAH